MKSLKGLKPRIRAQYDELMASLVPNQLLPPLGEQEFAELKTSIAEHGVRVPVLINTDGVIVDGHHRIQIADELGIYCPYELDSLELLAKLIKAEPEKSDRHHARVVGVDHKTAGTTRARLESTGEIPQLESRLGSDGKARPANRPNHPRIDQALVAEQKAERDRLGWIERLCMSLVEAIDNAETVAHDNNRQTLIEGWAENPKLRPPMSKHLSASDIRQAADRLNRIADEWSNE